jgi:hypothetical protein
VRLAEPLLRPKRMENPPWMKCLMHSMFPWEILRLFTIHGTFEN